MKKMAVIIFLGMFFVLSTGNTLTPVYANEEVQELSPIVVTASPVRDSVIGDFSTSKVIYTAEDIEKMKTNDVAGVLNNISSVSLMGEGIFGSRTVGRNRIKIRGHNAKIMIDGRPVSMEVFNCVINNVLTLNGIKRIEITRSGEAVLSGTDGLGGVINIITRTPGKYRSQFSGKFGTDNSGVASLLTENSFDDYY
jgi:outer membrane receptor for ferrienterochelin and colicin